MNSTTLEASKDYFENTVLKQLKEIKRMSDSFTRPGTGPWYEFCAVLNNAITYTEELIPAYEADVERLRNLEAESEERAEKYRKNQP